MSFLGPKPNQDPMNNVFEQKKFLGKKFFGTPGTPDRKKFRARPGPAGGPKVVQIVPLGVSNPSKTVGRPQKWSLKPNKHVKTFCPAKVMPKTRFLASLGFLARFGGRLGPRLCSGPQNSPKFENAIKIWNESFDPNFFAGFSRTLKGLD